MSRLERESRHGYHSTGRSAATLVEHDSIRPVPSGFCDNPLLNPCPFMLLYSSGNLPQFEASIEALREDRIAFEVMNSAQANEHAPALALQDEDRAIVLTADGRIDVHELLTSFLRHARGRGAVIRTSSEVRDVIVENGRCGGIVTDAGMLTARWIVDAAGAWAGQIAQLAGATDIPLEPRRRTM